MKIGTLQAGTKSYHPMVWLAMVGVCFFSQAAQAATLNVDVLSPTPPITDLDPIELRVLSSADLLPDTSWSTHMTSLTINGFDIDWALSSSSEGEPGFTMLIPVTKREWIGPLPVGTYNVTAVWGGLIGTTEFTVIPEPATLAMMSGGLCLLGVRRRR